MIASGRFALSLFGFSATMRLGKRLLKTSVVQHLLARLCALYFSLIKRTVRWSVDCPPATRQLFDQETPCIGCFWHGRLALVPAAVPHRRFHMLISGHRDGLLVARGVSYLGYATVAGSSRRGGVEASLRLQRLIKDGESMAITPDGPRGPRMRAKAGAIKIAKLSGAPLIPVGLAVSRRRLLGSWDRFCLAAPFCRGAILYGAPIPVPAELDPAAAEALRLALEQQLNALTAEADRRCGQSAVEPAPPSDRLSHARA